MTALVGEPGTCRAAACAKPIQWAETPKGRRAPIDVEPSPTGNMRLQPRIGALPLAVVLGPLELDAARTAGEPLYTSHFATCPARAGFRR